jgi:hypothetical protein
MQTIGHGVMGTSASAPKFVKILYGYKRLYTKQTLNMHPKLIVGREAAIPLGRSKQQVVAANLSARVCTDAAQSDALPNTISPERLEEMRKHHAENTKRAQERLVVVSNSQRTALCRRVEEDEKQRVDSENRKRKAIAVIEEAGARSEDDPHSDHQPHHPLTIQQHRPSKRKVTTTPSTSGCCNRQATTTLSFDEPVAPPLVPPLLWAEDGAFGPNPNAPEPLSVRAFNKMQKGSTPDVKYQFAEQLLKNGLVAFSQDGENFIVDGMSADDWKRSGVWCEFVSTIEVSKTRDAYIKRSGQYSVVKLGNGTFNMVVLTQKGSLPNWIPDKAALRFTRPWKDSNGNYRYQNISVSSQECANAMFASSMRIGVPVYSVTGYVAPNDGRSLKYGVAMTMERALFDMGKEMHQASSEQDGARIAKSIVDLLLDASLCKVLFYDIKPGNVLAFGEQDLRYHLLTDYDPAFFIVTKERDWKCLLLCNLALMSAHVYTGSFGDAGTGFLRFLQPLLLQMLRMRDHMDGEWLFCTRSVTVSVTCPKDHSDFELQRMLAQMCTCYFYGPDVESNALSTKWKWDKSQQVELDQYWRVSRAQRSWPPSWRKPTKPLIQQLIDMALSEL